MLRPPKLVVVISGKLANVLLASFAISVLKFSAFGSGATAPNSITLAWDPSPDRNVVGYRLFIGIASQVYTNVSDMGAMTKATISALVSGETYYFAVTAYDGSGLESSFSGEISYTVPVIAPGPTLALGGLSVAQNPPGQMTITGTGQAGLACTVWATQDFSTWTAIGSVTIGATGDFQFTDPGGVLVSKRFYRVETGPATARSLIQPAIKTSSQ